MIRAARAVLFTALGIWMGGLLTLGALVAPTLFQKAGSRSEAGRLFGELIARFDTVELVLGACVLATAWILRKAPDMSWPRPRIFLASLLAVLVIITGFGIHPTLANDARKLGPIEKLAEDDPFRKQFQTLHRLSEALGMAKVVAGLGLLVLSAASLKAAPRDGA